MAGERSEAPTPRRREEARKRGQVARSQEMTAAVGILASFILLQWAGPRAFVVLRDLMADTYRQLSPSDLTMERLGQLCYRATAAVGEAAGPLVLGVMVCGVVVGVGQTGLLFSTQAFKPDFGRLNPLRGLSRMVSGRAWLDLVKAIVKITICGLALYQIWEERYDELFLLGSASPQAGLAVVADVAIAMGLKVGGLLAALALLDFAYQRFQHERGLRMSREEVKEEMRNAEGDPQVRSRMRSQMRSLVRRRMMAAVPKADVIVTNPTHLAIALRYEPKAMGAPRVVAKGERLMAERIIALAKEHKVPIVRNVPLAHALYRSVEVGADIPASLYRAVAEVLAFVYRLREQRRAQAVG